MIETLLNYFILFQPQTNSLPGPFNLAPSHMFGNRLNPNSAMAALIAQSETPPAGEGSHMLTLILILYILSHIQSWTSHWAYQACTWWADGIFGPAR